MAKILAKNLFDYLDGLGDLPQNSVFRVVLEGEFLSLYRIKLKTFGADEIIQHYKISTSDILALDQVKTSELQNQSVVGRGVVGGLLFGPVGALLGGMSATGKQKIKTTLAISYVPSNGNEPKTVILADAAAWGGNNAVSIAKLKNELAKQPKSERVVRYLGQTVNEDGSITL